MSLKQIQTECFYGKFYPDNGKSGPCDGPVVYEFTNMPVTEDGKWFPYCQKHMEYEKSHMNAGTERIVFALIVNEAVSNESS